jgi:hypothetical protein
MHIGKLFIELPVLVLPEQRVSDGGESISLEQFQSFFEGVIDINLASSAHDCYTSSTITQISERKPIPIS